MGENVAMLHFVHVLDLSAAADDAGKHKHVCGDIVMTHLVKHPDPRPHRAAN